MARKASSFGDDPCSLNVTTASGLVDVVISACTECPNLGPICPPRTPAAVGVAIANRLLIWHVVRPLVDAGCRRLYIVASPNAKEPIFSMMCMSKDFEKVDATIIDVTDGSVENGNFMAAEQSHQDKENTEAPQAAQASGSTLFDLKKTASTMSVPQRAGDAQSGTQQQQKQQDRDDDDERERPYDTADALRAYARHKRRSPRHRAAADVLFINAETVMAGIDLTPFIAHFYEQRASCSVLMYEPSKKTSSAFLPATDTVTLPALKQDGTTLYDSKQPLHCVGVEMSPSSSSSASSSNHSYNATTGRGRNGTCAPGSSSSQLTHRRLHFFRSAEEMSTDKTPLSTGFIVRRPQLVFNSTLVDGQVCLLKHWVIGLVEMDRDILSVTEDLIPLLARRQLPAVSADDGLLRTPSEQLTPASVRLGKNGGVAASATSTPQSSPQRAASEVVAGPGAAQPLSAGLQIPSHWALGALSNSMPSLQACNANQNLVPSREDESRVFITVYKSTPRQRVFRVNNVEAFHAVCREAMIGVFERKPGQQASATTLVATAFSDSVAPFLKFDTYAALQGEAASGGSGTVTGCGILSAPPPTATLKTTVVGRGVSFGPNVRVHDSVLLDGCELPSGAQIFNCVVCAGVTVPADAGRLANVVISADGKTNDYNDWSKEEE